MVRGFSIYPSTVAQIWTLQLVHRIGQGYFTGIFATTVMLRLSDWSGAGLHFWGLAAALALFGIGGVIIQLRQPRPAANRLPRFRCRIGKRRW